MKNIRAPGAPFLITAVVLVAGAALACRAVIPSPDAVATGRCLGPFCLGMTRAAAHAAAGAAADADAACLRLAAGGPDLSLFGGESIAGVLITSTPRCADAGGRTDAAGGALPAGIADCRGVRLGDPAAFVGKMHRQARPVEPAGDLWPDAPAGVRGLIDHCGVAASDASPTTLYLFEDRVVGIGIGGRS